MNAKLTIGECTVPETNVSVYEALYQRRMAWSFKDEAVPREVLERLLETAVWAPNHRLTEPWRIFVLEKGSEALEKAAGLAHDFRMQMQGNQQRADATRQSMMDTPVIMYPVLHPRPGRGKHQGELCLGLLRRPEHGLGGRGRGSGRHLGDGWPHPAPRPGQDAGGGRRVDAGDHAVHRLPRRRPPVDADSRE